MDGPLAGPPAAFAKLAALNPLLDSARPGKKAVSQSSSPSGAERTVVILRPDAVRRGLISEICKRFERRGLSLVAMKMLKPGSDLASKHYEPLLSSCSRTAVASAIRAIAAEPCVATCWKGPSAVRAVLALVGDEDPSAAPPGTVRGDLSLAAADSLVECADSAEEAARLEAIWFDAADLCETASSPPLSSQPAAGSTCAASTTHQLERYYITTAINYANGPPHMGHAYEGVLADVIARYHRAYGREVFFLTGADEHGQKIADTAASMGIAPIELCDKSVSAFQDLNVKLEVSNDGYVRTTSAHHKKLSQSLWRKAVQKGDLYLGMYTGWYNVREETFVTESEAAASDYLDPVSGKPLKKMEEPSYFFKMSKFQDRLMRHLHDNPGFVRPEARRNEVLERLAVPLQDLSVSRTTFAWGIPVPDAPEHVMYVWFDALSNYLTGIGYDGSKTVEENQSLENARFWPADCHLIGKDISWFHCVIWPTLLMSVDIELPKCILGHGFIHGADGRKMSKSLGNVVDPYDALSRFPLDSFRFFLVRESSVGNDISFSETAIALRQNSELADTYGNLVHRALSLCSKYCGGKVPDSVADDVVNVSELVQKTEAAMQAYALDIAFGYSIQALNTGNKYVTDASPWHMSADDPKRLVVVRTLLEVIYVASVLLQPVLVSATAKVFEKLNTPPRTIVSLSKQLDNIKPGTETSVGDVLFAKVETAEALEKAAADAAAKKKAIEAAAKKQSALARAQTKAADQSDLSKCRIVVGKILQVNVHPEADSLYVEQIDIGEDVPRQVVSGLVKHIPIEQMKGRAVVVLANLKANKLRGVESQAMVLCATSSDGSTVELVEPPEGATIGERVQFQGHDGEPEATLNPKKKVWEKEVQPKLNTSPDRVARFEELAFTTSAGVCTVKTVACGTIK